jgi:DNA-binding MarR family transcriptional regulator
VGPTPGDEPRIVELLHQLGSQMHGIGGRFAAEEHLHQTDVQALSALALAGGRLTAGELAAAVELSSGATTRLVDRLERVGHVARHPDPDDRRRRQVAITPDAARTAAAFFGALSRTVEGVLDDYDTDEQATIRSFLADLVVALEHHTGPMPTGGTAQEP